MFAQVLPKPNGLVLPLSGTHSDVGPCLKDLTYSQHLHYVSQTNYKNLWKEAQKRFPEAYRPFALSRTRNQTQKSADGVETLRILLARTFRLPVISLETGSTFLHQQNATKGQSEPPQQTTLKALAVFESATHFIVVSEFVPHSVHRCLSLSPALLVANSARPMFVLFQMLHIVKELQDRSLFVEGVSWQRFFIGEDLSLKVLPAAASSLIPLDAPKPPKREPSLEDLTMSWVPSKILFGFGKQLTKEFISA